MARLIPAWGKAPCLMSPKTQGLKARSIVGQPPPPTSFWISPIPINCPRNARQCCSSVGRTINLFCAVFCLAGQAVMPGRIPTLPPGRGCVGKQGNQPQRVTLQNRLGIYARLAPVTWLRRPFPDTVALRRRKFQGQCQNAPVMPPPPHPHFLTR